MEYMLKVYNALSGKKEIFRPIKGKKVNLFVCGPTTYDFSHIGHARTYIVFDMIAKYLKERGLRVFYLQNLTDVDDKIIARAKREKISWHNLSRQFEREYLKDMKSLNINSVTKYARATEHIKEILSQVKRLLEKGFAYQIKNGIYYDIKKFKDYGKLSKRTVLQAEDAISRIDTAKGKKNKGDFCLWKKSPHHPAKAGATGQAKLFEPSWQSPWGLGRPGWHIEDTAICEKYFGPQYDIHGGARDLIFPHHEAEIAQMEAISGTKPMVKYWLHAGFLTLKGEKMAKSLGNLVTIKNFLKRYSPRILRYFLSKSHYRSPLDYNEKIVFQAKRELERIDEFVEKIQISNSKFQINSKFKTSKFENEFEKAMEDDFNTPKAIAIIFNLVNKGNSLIAQNKLNTGDKKEILEFLRKRDRIFNFIFWQRPKKEKISGEILRLIKEREQYRKIGKYLKADKVRKKIKKLGYWIEDTKEGPKIKKP